MSIYHITPRSDVMEQTGQIPRTRYYVAMFIAIFGWGLSVPFVEFGLSYIKPLPFLAYRFVLASIILTPFVLLTRYNELIELIKHPWMWIVATAESLGLVFQYLGQQQGVPAGLAALLSLCFLLIVPFLSPLFLDDQLQFYHLVAIVFGFVGIVLISTEGKVDNLISGQISILGVVLLLGAAFGYALYIVATSRLTTIEMEDVDTFALFYLVLVIVALYSTVFTATFSTFQPVVKSLWIWLILLAIFSTLIAFFAYFEALKGISANSASVLLLLQVLIPFTTDYWLLGRRYNGWVISGAVAIITAMLVVVIYPYWLQQQS